MLSSRFNFKILCFSYTLKMTSTFKVTFIALLFTVSTNAELSEGDTCTQNNGSPGVCKIINNCQAAKDELAQGIVPTACGFKNRIPLVCCPESLSVIKPTPNPVTQSEIPKLSTASLEPDNTLSKSKQKCKEYSSFVYTNDTKEGGEVALLVPFYEPSGKGKSQCVDGKTFIIGVFPAVPKEFPHMAAIGYGEKDSTTWGCGGSLISERFVLTAAHCVTSPSWGIAKWIRLGDLDIKTTDDPVRTQDFSIAEIFRHPDYARPAVYNDIALIKLDRNAKFDGYVRPACIHAEESVPNENLVASAWEYSSLVGSEDGNYLAKVDMKNIDPTICNDTFSSIVGGTRLKDGVTPDTMLCAGYLEGVKDSCKGGSGGPLQVKLMNPYCMFDIIGIMSFGSVCGGSNAPFIYTRVSHFIPWIESIVWP